MLQKNAVPAATLDLLKQISALKELSEFGLGGGTNIALRLGHRLSVDLDFFTNQPFDTSQLFQLITEQFPSAELLFEKNQTMMFNTGDTKVDFVLYPFPWLQPFDIEDGIRLISFYDIIPMKLQAASNRNAKKDYWDIAVMLQQFELEEMLRIFKNKFPKIDTGYIVHSLTDFEKADSDLDPEIQIDISWDEIKGRLAREVKKYTKRFL
jgi:Nucleotidyl transferase AbiEii toxin, Type IV TA system